MKNRSCCCKLCFLIPFGIAALLALVTYAVYSLWNCVLTDVLPVKAITFWQALGLLVLSKILFGGFPHKGGCGCGSSMRERFMAKRWASATPEQREEMREEWRRRFGDDYRPRWCCDDKKPDEPGKPSGTDKA